MNNEREMLEFAAKACGITKDDSAYNGGGSNNTGFDIMGNLVTDWHNGESWNPLTNSADCAAMCAKLYIDTMWFLPNYVCCGTTQHDANVMLDKYDDQESAWRYAATMVAAKIGGIE